MTLESECAGWALVLAVHALTIALHLFVPAPGDLADGNGGKVNHGTPGYACDCATRKVLLYRNNGFRVLLWVLAIVAGSGADVTVFARYFWPCARASCLLGLAVSYWLLATGKKKLTRGDVDRGSSCLTVSGPRSAAAENSDEFDKRTTWEHFYCGIEWNPRPLWGIDIKMYNYLFGAVLLALNLLSGIATHMQGEHKCFRALFAYALPLGWFVCEYMWFENVHVYTYDIFRERTGFKMVWGCFFFYPFFYTVGLWPLVADASVGRADLSVLECIGCVSLFFAGYCLTRGANMQKFYWRTGRRKMFLGFIEQRTVPGSKDRLLCSGFWGLSRHINYLGEIIQGVALALPGWLLTSSLVPWLYPLYYVALFVPRQMDDDAACAAKYGDSWARYCALVPWRIVPYVW